MAAKKKPAQHESAEAKHDRHFYDTFMLVLGILVAFAFGMYWLANGIAEANPNVSGRQAPLPSGRRADLRRRQESDGPGFHPSRGWRWQLRQIRQGHLAGHLLRLP